MNAKIISIIAIATLLFGCSKDVNDPTLTTENNDDKTITLSVTTSHLGGNGSQVSVRTMNGVAVTGSGADIDHYCWQWSNSDKLTVEVINPSTKKKETRIFSVKECGVTYVDKNGNPCDPEVADKNLSHDGWATFEGKMPNWWNESIEFDIYTGPESLPSKGYEVIDSDGLTNCMRFHGHVTDISQQIEMIAQWTIIVVDVQPKLRETSNEASDPNTVNAWKAMSWSYDISGVDILDSEDEKVDDTDEVKYHADFLASGTNGSKTQDLTSTFVFIVNPKDYIKGHMFVRVNINSSEWQLSWKDSQYEGILEKNDITTTSADLGTVKFGPEEGEGGLGFGLHAPVTMRVQKVGS